MYEMKLGMMILLLSVLVGVIPGATSWTTEGWPWTTDYYSCWSNCGYEFSSCSCSSSCEYYGNCCYDYADYCSYTTYEMLSTDYPSYSCGGHHTQPSGELTSPLYPSNYPNYAHCSWRIQSTGTKIIRLTFTYVSLETAQNCVYDAIRVYDGPSTSYPLLGTLCGTQKGTYSSSGNDLTVVFSTDGSVTRGGFVAHWVFEDFPSCMWNCDYNFANCSCTSSCQYYGNCCPDYYDYCYSTTTDHVETTTAPPSCRWNCGNYVGSCSCTSSCQYYGDCCPDYYEYCGTTTESPQTETAPPSCMWYCGYDFGSCSCSSSCQYYGTCCYDYYEYCVTTTDYPHTATDSPSCRWNCGYNLGSCSCSSSCQYYGNCCYDYYDYCGSTTHSPVTHPVCGGQMSGSGSISSPYYPNYYHDNAYCSWQISAPSGQSIFLSFVDLELDRCCYCDYVNVYDGSSIYSPLLGKLCNNDTTLRDFRSSSSYMTVLFRSDSSSVARGFQAFFTNSLSEDRARVTCSSDNMIIVIQKSYLNSLGISWYDLYVDDHRCRPTADSYEVSFNFPINMCGTSTTTNNGRVTYNNHVRAAPSQSGEITREVEHFLLNVHCHMEQETTVGTVYKVKDLITDTISGTGRFNASINFYPSSSFYYPIIESPYEVDINQYMYVQVHLNRADSTLDILLDSCITSPNPDFTDRSYTLIQNGCAVDSTTYIYSNGWHYYAQFRFRAFKFLRTHSFVYLQCNVIVCTDNDYNSRCRQGCRSSRKKRSLDSSHHTETVTLGPITLKGARSAVQVEKEE